MTALDDRIDAILDAVKSRVGGLGAFEAIPFHEPKTAPGGAIAALWVDGITPVGTASGLDIASAVLVVLCRIYDLFSSEPQDDIDPRVLKAAAAVIGAFVGEFDVSETVRNVDIFGTYGTALAAKAGYVNQDGTMYRVMTVSIPLVVNDLWAEVA
jgi:hypothetical protein